MCSVVCLSSFEGACAPGRRSQVVRQRSAKPPSSVQLRSPPPTTSLHLAISCGALPRTELEGLRRLEPRVVVIIYSIDPAIAALVGLVVLGENLSASQVLGMAAVIVASAGATASAGGAQPKGTQAQQDLREGGI
jgi:hypothetical protein